jgi:muramoyltetrapeptide carboxypeptidase
MKDFLSWDYLCIDEEVRIIAPASASSKEKLESGIEWLRAQGLGVTFSSKLLSPDLFFAAPLEAQCEDFRSALESDAKVLWCLRGGWGSMRLLPFLDSLTPPEKPKLLIGFSDITSLHLFLTQKWNWPTLHGRTITQLRNDWELNEEHEMWRKIIKGEIDEIAFNDLLPLNPAAKKNNSISSFVAGGNLRLIQSSLGTPWQIDVKGKILFLEDVSERGYSVDRMLEQMIQSGLLRDDPAAIIFGSFTEGLEKNGTDLVPKALERFAQRVNYPVLAGLPCGHGPHENYPLPFNTPAALLTGAENKLICKTGIKKN